MSGLLRALFHRGGVRLRGRGEENLIVCIIISERVLAILNVVIAAGQGRRRNHHRRGAAAKAGKDEG